MFSALKVADADEQADDDYDQADEDFEGFDGPANLPSGHSNSFQVNNSNNGVDTSLTGNQLFAYRIGAPNRQNDTSSRLGTAPKEWDGDLRTNGTLLTSNTTINLKLVNDTTHEVDNEMPVSRGENATRLESLDMPPPVNYLTGNIQQQSEERNNGNDFIMSTIPNSFVPGPTDDASMCSHSTMTGISSTMQTSRSLPTPSKESWAVESRTCFSENDIRTTNNQPSKNIINDPVFKLPPIGTPLMPSNTPQNALPPFDRVTQPINPSNPNFLGLFPTQPQSYGMSPLDELKQQIHPPSNQGFVHQSTKLPPPGFEAHQKKHDDIFHLFGGGGGIWQSHTETPPVARGFEMNGTPLIPTPNTDSNFHHQNKGASFHHHDDEISVSSTISGLKLLATQAASISTNNNNSVSAQSTTSSRPRKKKKNPTNIEQQKILAFSAPKSALHVVYGRAPRRKVVSGDHFHTFHDGGAAHMLRWTGIFVCPISGELFLSVSYPCGGSTVADTFPSEINHYQSLWGRYWFPKKLNAEHAAAAAAHDCMVYRDRLARSGGKEQQDPTSMEEDFYISTDKPYPASEAIFDMPEAIVPRAVREAVLAQQNEIRRIMGVPRET
jgi:hypothetical protein